MILLSCFQPASLTPHPAPLHIHVSVPSSLHSLLSSPTCVLELICSLSVCLFVSLSQPSFTLCFGTHLSSVCLSLSLILSLFLFLCLSSFLHPLFLNSFVLFSVCLFQCLSVCLSVSVSICLSVSVSICPSVSVSICLSVFSQQVFKPVLFLGYFCIHIFSLVYE